jgi:transposase-like protein
LSGLRQRIQAFRQTPQWLAGFRCLSCRKTFTEAHARGFRVEDYLKEQRGLTAIGMLVEGCSIRSVERLTGHPARLP